MPLRTSGASNLAAVAPPCSQEATAQLEASVEVPSLNFRWKSDSLEMSSAAFGVIGQEANGRYFTP